MAWAENAMPAAASAFLSTMFIWYLLDVRGDYARRPGRCRCGAVHNGLVCAAEQTRRACTLHARGVISATAARRLLVPVGVGVLAVIGVVAALYLARAFFVPLLIGILGSYALRPLVDWLKALHIPRAAGAALVLGVLVGGFSWAALSLGDDAAAIVASLPDAARKLRQQGREAQAQGPNALQT